MSRLAIENSTSQGSLAVEAPGRELEIFRFQGSAELGPVLHQALARVDPLSEVIVGIGPGTYTGLRVAIASAIGLEWSLGVKTFGCPSVLGYAEQSYAVIGDARRSSFAVSVVRNGTLAEGPELIGKEEVSSFLAANREFPIFAVNEIPGWPHLQLQYPEARYLLEKRASFTPLDEPIYLKEPHTTKPRQDVR